MKSNGRRTLLAVCLLLCMGVAIAAGLAVLQRRAEERRITNVRKVLEKTRSFALGDGLTVYEGGRNISESVTGPWPPANGSADDQSGLVALSKVLKLSCAMTDAGNAVFVIIGESGYSSESRDFKLPAGAKAIDAWGHMLVYRCPGPIHAQGWDLYSVGPNGVDEHGEGDDILVGEDVASIMSAE